jgi:hypothetical protein
MILIILYIRLYIVEHAQDVRMVVLAVLELLDLINVSNV